ncbi:ABC transporter permease [Arthrobacter sp. 2MCAF15]|uniref:ABC transporter permease n=1 Tax=Arthrobacter sp. 2MCAF15 TaxID=3232984 RepID=UPI003F90B606
MNNKASGKSPALVAFCVLAGLLLIAPTLVVVPLSFNEKQSYTLPTGWSLRWYENFFSDSAWFDSAMLSLRVAPVVALIATVLGTAASLALVRGSGRWRQPVQALLVSPMVVPGVIVAIGIYYVFLRWHLTETFIGFVIAHTIMAVPFVIVTVSASLQGVDRQIERAAAVLGASPLKTFFTITLPIVMPGILTGALFAFLTSFDESIISLFLSGPSNRTLPVQLYQSVTAEIDPTGAAAATILITLTSLLLLLVGLVTVRRSTSK